MVVLADVEEIEKSRTFNPADYSVLGFPTTNQSVINQDVLELIISSKSNNASSRKNRCRW